MRARPAAVGCGIVAGMSPPLILLTGATGYVGGRLMRRLEEPGGRVRCLARRPEFLQARVGPQTEVARGDVLDAASLGPALRGVEVAYYLVHSMGSTGNFEEQDRQAARNFAAAARAAGVRRIVYLGGLGADVPELSPHLRSRHEVGDILRESGVPVIEFRASIVIGSGSLSFELVRALVERLPVMVTPRWVQVVAQPIGINDLLEYLLAAMTLSDRDDPPGRPSAENDAARPAVAPGHQIYEIGGPDVVAYADLMREYARQRGLRRWMIPVPVLTPRLSSLWLGLVTPVYARVGRKLIDSIRHPTVVRDRAALEKFAVRPVGVRAAIAQALRREDREFAETHWAGAVSSAGEPRQWGGVRLGNRLIDTRSVVVAVPAEKAFAPLQRIGGTTGWYFGNWLWRVRGWLDLVVGGVGMRRGRRHPSELRVGEAVDCWRVEEFVPGRRLRLVAEMNLPGRAWLEFEVVPAGEGARITQTAMFDPHGLAGLAYWYGIWPLHELVFAGMVRQIGHRAVAAAARSTIASAAVRE
ncbi:MAG: hypothetical protein PCFJNLEI_03240 [Verrucomicrobiae bacterium]|nr:hypothetical protein [Verrucomicrobiae bacterium]